MDSIDSRLTVFCSTDQPELFHAVANRTDIWKPDAFDVETIHEDARDIFQRLVNRAASPEGSSTGRILLLLGEAGSGKTHLMRAFRNWTHARGRGYCGYMQMTSASQNYARYVLNNLIDSLDRPYDQRSGELSGLMRLSTAIAQSSKGVPLDRITQIRDNDLDYDCLARMVEALADQIVMDERFNNVDIDLIRALIYLQSQDPRIKSRVLKYLRCEDLSAYDRRILGDMVPRSYDDAPQWVIQRFGELLAALEGAPLILLIDQLEDIFKLDATENPFRRVLSTVCDLVSRIPTAVVVISCLEDFYAASCVRMPRSLLDRIERDPAPITLKGAREHDEIVALLGHRLRHLYESHEVHWVESEPTYPYPEPFVQALAGLPTREVLARCQEFRERCVRAGQLVRAGEAPSPASKAVAPPTATGIEQAWNDFRSAFAGEVPSNDPQLAGILAQAIRECSLELDNGDRFEAEVDEHVVRVSCRHADDAVTSLLIGVCNLNARGGGLSRQITQLEDRAAGAIPVVVRSTDFPSSPNAAIVRQLGALIGRGGRRTVVEDSEWRAMMAMAQFRANHATDPAFPAWLRDSRPLTQLKSIRAIFDLDHPREWLAPPPSPPPAAPPDSPPVHSVDSPTHADVTSVSTGPCVDPATAIEIGVSNDRSQSRVHLAPEELTRHAAFLGGSGSGKTTVALNIVEQLLLRGIPAILVDRKGDLCGYANPAAWSEPIEDGALASRRDQLRRSTDVALFTPGNPQGRPLSISIVPPGMEQLSHFDREQVARYAASGLAAMMNYGSRSTEPARQAVLEKAINLLAQHEPGRTITLELLVEYVAEQDPMLVNAVGRLDTKVFDRLVQDLETLRLSRGTFLAAEGEPLEAEALLGLGSHARPGKTRLSIISTKFLGPNSDVQYWVSHLLVELTRWVNRSPSSALQAVLLLDEADLYLPAQRQPPTKEPMENLLRRARSAGLGLMLATQSPGDFDYKCRDNIRTWVVGRVREATSLTKMKPMLTDCRVDIAARLPTQGTGEFHVIRDGNVTSLRSDRSVLRTAQLPEDEILNLARAQREPLSLF